MFSEHDSFLSILIFFYFCKSILLKNYWWTHNDSKLKVTSNYIIVYYSMKNSRSLKKLWSMNLTTCLPSSRVISSLIGAADCLLCYQDLEFSYNWSNHFAFAVWNSNCLKFMAFEEILLLSGQEYCWNAVIFLQNFSNVESASAVQLLLQIIKLQDLPWIVMKWIRKKINLDFERWKHEASIIFIPFVLIEFW